MRSEGDRSMFSASLFAAEMDALAEKWTSPRPTRITARSGMVLIVVVVVVAMLSLAGLAFVVNLQTENRAARAEGRRLQLAETAASGAEWIKAFCQRPWTEQQEAGGTWDNAERFRGILVFEDQATGRRAWFSVIAPNEAGQTAGARFGLENESGKLNLGALLRWDRREPGRGRQGLMSLPGMTSSIADAILDWIDPDASPRPGGAEADYYRELGVPYRPRNGVPQCLEELLLVRGVTRELLFGHDEDFNGADDGQQRSPAERPAAGALSAGPGGTPWARLLTLSSAERNQTLAGQPRTDVNAPDLQSLHQKLSSQLDRAWADYIVLYRQFGPYSGNKPATTSPPSVDFARPGRVRVRSLLDLVGSKVGQPSADGRELTVVGSPAGAEPAALREHLTRLLDGAATTGVPVTVGKVNVNLAPREVLQAVPGMDPALVDRIVIARSSQGSREDASRQFPTWLLTEGLVDLARMRALLPYLTCGGDVFRAQVVAMHDQPGPAVRVEVAIDATSVPPKQVYWKDLSLLGPGHDRATLGFETEGSGSRPGRSRQAPSARIP